MVAAPGAMAPPVVRSSGVPQGRGVPPQGPFQGPPQPGPVTGGPPAGAQPGTPGHVPQPQQAQAPVPQPQKQNRVTAMPRPIGLDPLLILQERENRVAARISHRMEELSNLPTTMSEDLRIKAEIELRALRVLNFQRQLRSEVQYLF